MAGWLIPGYGPMEPSEFSKEVDVSDNRANQPWMIVFVRDIQRQLLEGLCTKA
jgi:hypothetical protein